jgi:hypothetical protein
MRCKVGDLAVILRADGKFDAQSIGWLVEVIGPGDDWSDEGDSRWHWLCKRVGDGKLPCVNVLTGRGRWAHTADFADSDLWPIRDPGEDATDEMLLIVPSPALEPA